MKVKLISTLADAEKCHQPGDVISVSEKEGKLLIEGGYAVKVGNAEPIKERVKIDEFFKKEKAEHEEIETAEDYRSEEKEKAISR